MASAEEGGSTEEILRQIEKDEIDRLDMQLEFGDAAEQIGDYYEPVEDTADSDLELTDEGRELLENGSADSSGDDRAEEMVPPGFPETGSVTTGKTVGDLRETIASRNDRPDGYQQVEEMLAAGVPLDKAHDQLGMSRAEAADIGERFDGIEVKNPANGGPLLYGPEVEEEGIAEIYRTGELEEGEDEYETEPVVPPGFAVKGSVITAERGDDLALAIGLRAEESNVEKGPESYAAHSLFAPGVSGETGAGSPSNDGMDAAFASFLANRDVSVNDYEESDSEPMETSSYDENISEELENDRAGEPTSSGGVSVKQKTRQSDPQEQQREEIEEREDEELEPNYDDLSSEAQKLMGLLDRNGGEMSWGQMSMFFQGRGEDIVEEIQEAGYGLQVTGSDEKMLRYDHRDLDDGVAEAMWRNARQGRTRLDGIGPRDICIEKYPRTEAELKDIGAGDLARKRELKKLFGARGGELTVTEIDDHFDGSGEARTRRVIAYLLEQKHIEGSGYGFKVADWNDVDAVPFVDYSS